jgi:hypothetical protein
MLILLIVVISQRSSVYPRAYISDLLKVIKKILIGFLFPNLLKFIILGFYDEVEDWKGKYTNTDFINS